ncbi:DNA-formamidopyrimidine glycosylase [Floricoccus penangensis]|uniref:DNA-formamidopyrimidine glycosylase n=1 Tax=Floricoccus penangensis TaxID=1859475 RepID=UPI00203D4F4E|nr:DNA-formamidopyrimidine glycosylase [Floricoccus penangensis]URZ86748.1 DNA-formamidopyrimidine glycosylase [Floricoccus penangensis]
MPELPEVENVRRGLTNLVKGKKISSVEARYPRMVLTGAEEFEKALKNQTINSVERRGKYLIFKLDEDVFVSHLRMEGKYNLYQDEIPENKHYHIFFNFEDGSTLVYQDVRKFGTMELMKESELDDYFSRKKIGPEPTFEDFDSKEFYKSLHKSKKIIKPYLLDQSLVAGLGNIYVDEVLWRAKIYPADPANIIPIANIEKLHDAIIEVLQQSVELGGSSIRTYKNALGEEGKFQNHLKVYGKQGTPCPRCGTTIEKMKVSGRGTHFCPKCQPKRAK